MPRAPLEYARRHSIALLALACSLLALGGSAYAAFHIANHSIDPVKLNPRYIGGYVRGWVSVSADGRVTASGGKERVQPDPGVAPGHYIINWRPRPTSKCEATGGVDLSTSGGPSVPGYVVTQSFASRALGEQTAVQVYDSQGHPAMLAYDLQLICATPR